MQDRKTALEMVGEFFREAAVLSAVFIPLDQIMMHGALTVGWGMAILGVSGGLFALGTAIERMRDR